MKRVFALLSSLVILAVAANAQEVQNVEMRVYVTWSDGSRLGDSSQSNGMPGVSNSKSEAPGVNSSGNSVSNMDIRISVQSDAGNTIAEKSPGGEGYASFVLPAVVIRTTDRARTYPAYRIRIQGPTIEEQFIDDVHPGLGDRMVNVTLHKKGERKEAGGGVVSTTSLKIPKKATKELEKGKKALEASKLPEARAHFEKAVEIYPQFDVAYNALGVTLMKMGDATGGRKAFEQALAANDKFAPAYVNLARIQGTGEDYEAAATSLTRSLSLEPLNAEALSLLCQYDVLRGKYEDVPALAAKLHSIPHDGQALGHYAAATALEQTGHPTEAIFEYMLFMKEDPMSNLSASAKEQIDRLRQQTSQAKPQ